MHPEVVKPGLELKAQSNVDRHTIWNWFFVHVFKGV